MRLRSWLPRDDLAPGVAGPNQDSTNNPFGHTTKPQPESENIEKTRHEIAEVIQSFPELRFQVLGTSDFAIATIKNTKYLKNGRADDDAHVIAAYQEYTGDERQNTDRYCPRAGMDGKLEQNARYPTGNRPIQKP